MPRRLLPILILAGCCWAQEPTAADRAAALFKEAEQLARQNDAAGAVAKSELGVTALAEALAAKQKTEWSCMDGLRRASQTAREGLLDYEKALFFADKLMEFNEGDYWRVPARLERALTHRAMGEFAKAAEEYETIAAGDARSAPRMLLPQAEMVYFDQHDQEQGQKLLDEALMNEQVNTRERYNAVMQYAARALDDGDQDAAMTWYARIEQLPVEKSADRTKMLSRVWYEMGRIESSRGQTAAAKQLYRKAMELEGGEMRFRVRARDALEGLEYFE